MRIKSHNILSSEKGEDEISCGGGRFKIRKCKPFSVN